MKKSMAIANRLLESTIDSLLGFEHIAAHSHVFGFYAFCERHALERQRLAKALRQTIEGHGVKTEGHGTLLGTAHRLFLDIRNKLSSGDIAIIEELMRGESFMARHLEESLGYARMPADVRAILGQLAVNVDEALHDLQHMQVHARHGHGAVTFSLAGRK